MTKSVKLFGLLVMVFSGQLRSVAPGEGMDLDSCAKITLMCADMSREIERNDAGEISGCSLATAFFTAWISFDAQQSCIQGRIQSSSPTRMRENFSIRFILKRCISPRTGNPLFSLYVEDLVQVGGMLQICYELCREQCDCRWERGVHRVRALVQQATNVPREVIDFRDLCFSELPAEVHMLQRELAPKIFMDWADWVSALGGAL
jgi:hypothetical protein